ncbi:helix-turn-helix transcriptional regulator [Streptomyces sp. ISL-98]|uniref:ArsR/SmtB family transcription factor n=1 Tax=Streptomyces sp. ISL-98 TaxID=2819192 RepID=UPI001BEC345B|nr:helix-turn-helix domain-containing protein [Streptomyces sp. ISL-98]MBT2508163.1 helix-turn-helix transcriptional regulator [Streptomyces sp. ISL-98]
MAEPEVPKERKEFEEPDTRVLDARSLRGLAHPLRIQLLKTLRHYGPATASQLAERLGESSGATSYHLRQLATHGFVEDDPERGKGRERWWKAAQEGISFSPELHNSPDPAVRGAADLFLHELANIHTQEVGTWLGTSREWPEEWARSADLSDFTLQLTAEQLSELNHKVRELIDSYRGLTAEGSAQVRIHTHSFPRRATD